MIPVFITSFFRLQFTERVVKEIHHRTDADTFSISVLDNGSDEATINGLWILYKQDAIQSLHLLNHNTGCVHGKHVFNALVPDSQEFHVVTDNDFIPCKGWLPRMLEIMSKHPRLACLTLDYPPRWPLEPIRDAGNYVETHAIGNTFKLCRTAAMREVFPRLPNDYGLYGDDGELSAALRSNGWSVGYAKSLYCYNLERTLPNWGYNKEELAKDPRKAGYAPPPPPYEPLSWETLEPPDYTWNQ